MKGKGKGTGGSRISEVSESERVASLAREGRERSVTEILFHTPHIAKIEL